MSLHRHSNLLQLTLIGFLTIFAFPNVLAQESSSYEELYKTIMAPRANKSIGTDLFGDSVNLYSGTLSFTQKDISIPGNNALPVMVGRRIKVGEDPQGGKSFARWELDIPHIYGTFAQSYGWKAGDLSDARCSKFGAPPTALGVNDTSYWESTEYWHGSFMYIPGVGDQRLLLRHSSNTSMVPSPASAYPVVTTNAWAISCLSTLKNAGSGANPVVQGEGFLAIAPDGTKYYFDWLARYPATTLRRATETALSTLAENQQLSSAASPVAGGNMVADVSANSSAIPANQPSPNAINGAALQRSEIWLLPSKVVDRFGNTVTYTYDSQKPRNLMRIDSSDGRSLVFTYRQDTNGINDVISTVTDGTRTWTYSYHDYPVGVSGSTVFNLDKVTLPDNSSWDFSNFDSLFIALKYRNNGSCDTPPVLSNPRSLSGAMVHPTGATATFNLGPITHGRSHVPYACADIVSPPVIPKFFITESLVQKVISGPGIPSMTWSFDYGATNESWENCTSCISTKSVTVEDPESHVTRYTFGNAYNINEGRLVLTDYDWNGSTAIKSVENRYRAFGAGPYPDYVGYGDPSNAGDEGIDIRLAPIEQIITTQQNSTFAWTATAFDEYAHPVNVSRSSSLGFNRSETISYDNNLENWVLGQVKQVVENNTNKVVVRNDYAQTTTSSAPATSLLSVSEFGKLQRSMTYYGDGTVKTVTDEKGQAVTSSNYMRGIPQRVDYQDGSFERAVVDNVGNISSLTNEAGSVYTFGYDAMGRLASITYPGADSTAWNQTLLSFSKVSGTEHGLDAGHWKQIVQTGKAFETSFYDALLRPVYVERYDSDDVANTSRIVKHEYDSVGRPLFDSYPKRSYDDLGDGVWNGYDALGRVTGRATSTELGKLYEYYAYIDGFQTHHVDANGNNTVYSYQAFDQPTYEAITGIAMPEGVSVSIGRDVFGKTRSITRGGNGISLTRSYVYDGYERLCKTVEPETGATVQDYDAADNVSWRATGLSLTSTSACDTASVPAAKKALFGYDTRNRLRTTTFGDGSPSITRTYTLDGLLETVSSNGTQWTYGYNKRRLLESEILTYGGTSYAIGRTYDSNGSLSQLRYPADNLAINYNPNALGEPRQVSNGATGYVYAKNITYHPSGAISNFTYGNGIQRTMLPNIRGLPYIVTDAGILDDVYAYDNNGNVLGIQDRVAPYANTRGMSYDGLDRLKTVGAPNLWGTAAYTYDALDNIIASSVSNGQNARYLTHTINYGTNRLTSITNGPASFSFAYDYDGQGNIIKRGTQQFTFDLDNRLTSAPGRATYVYDGLGRRVSVVGTDSVNRIQVYSQAGQLLYTAPS